jgi:hypothetical protein
MDISFLLWIFLGVGLTIIILRNQKAKQYWQGMTTHTMSRVVPPGAGAPAPAPHPPAAVAHPPQTNPAPAHYTAHAAHGSGAWQWFKDHLWMVIPWTLVVGLAVAGLVLYSPKDAKGLNMPNLSSIFGEGSSIEMYAFPGLLILIGLILLLWPAKAGQEKKGH